MQGQPLMNAPTPARAFTTDERRIVHFTGFAHAATHFVELVYPTLAISIAADTGLSLADVLAWSFTGYLLFGVGSLPAGVAADRFGSRRVILAGLCGAGVSALVASFVAPGWPLALCLAGLGASASCYHPAGTGLLSRAVRARGRALGINGIYGNVGIAMAPLTTATLAGLFGWRSTLGLTGGVLLAATLLLSRLRLDEPARADVVDTPSPTPDAPEDPEPDSRHGIAPFVVICITAALGGFAYRANTLAQPALFAEQINFVSYGVAASFAMLIGVAGQYLGGVIADARDLRAGYLVFHLLSLPALIGVSLLSGAPLLVTSSLYVLFALGMQPIENSLFASVTPERWRSTAYGLKFVLTFGLGSSAVFMVRAVAESSGWASVYTVLIGVVVTLIGFIGLLFWLTRRAPLHNLRPPGS